MVVQVSDRLIPVAHPTPVQERIHQEDFPYFGRNGILSQCPPRLSRSRASTSCATTPQSGALATCLDRKSRHLEDQAEARKHDVRGYLQILHRRAEIRSAKAPGARCPPPSPPHTPRGAVPPGISGVSLGRPTMHRISTRSTCRTIWHVVSSEKRILRPFPSKASSILPARRAMTRRQTLDQRTMKASGQTGLLAQDGGQGGGCARCVPEESRAVSITITGIRPWVEAITWLCSRRGRPLQRSLDRIAKSSLWR